MCTKSIFTRCLIRFRYNKQHTLPEWLITSFIIWVWYRYTMSKLPEIKDGIPKINLLINATSSRRACRMPKLLIHDPLIKDLLHEEKPLKCAKEKNWVYVDNGRFYISDLAYKTHGKITCDIMHIQRIDDYHYSETKYGNVQNNTPLIGDMLRVGCRADDGATYQNLHVGVPVPKHHPEENIPKEQNGLKVNILMYYIDSVSRMNFMRKLPNFYRFLTEEFKGFTFEGYNIVGDATIFHVVPMSTGKFQQELPDIRKRFKNTTTIDKWPLIFKEYSAKQYVTTYIEEQFWSSVFHMGLKGFEKPPFDHYMRPIMIAVERHRRRQLPYCLGDTPESIVWLEYFRQLQVVHRPRGKHHFSVIFSAETSHDDYNTIQVLDDHLKHRFNDLWKDGYFNDTMVFVMTDHGYRFSSIRDSQTGKFEERLPFFFVRPPDGFCNRYPTICDNMRTNGDALVTAFDLHATLKHILNFKPDEEEQEASHSVNLSERGISIFKSIPQERTCAHAAIKAHFCSCLDWVEIEKPKEDTMVRGAVKYVVDKFNDQTTRDVGDACANLTIKNIISARYLKPNDKVLAFKESLDYDVFYPDLSDNMQIEAMTYQVQFVTEPGPGEWEVSVTYFVDLRKYAMPMDSISRLNKYGDQARCVVEEYSHLRMFCYCTRDKV